MRDLYRTHFEHGSGSADKPRMRVKFNESNFKLPAGDEPIIMCGPGTGVAPFIAFAEERQHDSKSSESWLYFGCREDNVDYIFKEEIKAFVDNSSITNV